MKKTTDKLPILGKTFRQHYFIWAVIISAVTIVHFALQMSFIQSGNQPFTESAGKIEPPVQQSAQSKPQERIIEKALAENEITQSDIATPVEDIVNGRDIVSQKIAVSQKTVFTESRRQPVNSRRQTVETIRKPIKNKIAREPETMRIRRAEQLLTGF